MAKRSETALLYDVQSNLNTLASALARWEIRDETRADPRARLAANAAMDAIDIMLRELHAMRSRLVTEIRISDAATATRADALIARGDGHAAAQITEENHG